MSILTQVSDKMQDILQTTANKAALSCGFVQRIRKLSGSVLTQPTSIFNLIIKLTL